MLKISLKVVFVCTLVLLAACSNEARRQNSSEGVSTHTSPVLAETWATWQEAYTALLRNYANQRPYADYFWANLGWHFTLHDIDRNGTPELFLVMRGEYYGMAKYSAVYTFINYKLTPLEFQSVVSWGMSAPMDGRAFIFDTQAVGMGDFYRRWDMDGLALVTTAEGNAVTLNEAGLEKVFNMLYAENQNWQSFEWFDLAIRTDGLDNWLSVIVQGFESTFIRWGERKRLAILPITDENIEQSISENIE